MTFSNKKLEKPWQAIGELHRQFDEQRPYPPHRVGKEHPFKGLFDLFDNVLYSDDRKSLKPKDQK